MIEFFSTPWGYFILCYIMVGCLIMRFLDRHEEDTPIIPWLFGILFWLPPLLIGFIRGLFKKG